MLLVVRGDCGVDVVEGLLSASPGMDPPGSHAPSLLQIQKVWVRSWGSRGDSARGASASGSRDQAVFTTRCLASS